MKLGLKSTKIRKLGLFCTKGFEIYEIRQKMKLGETKSNGRRGKNTKPSKST